MITCSVCGTQNNNLATICSSCKSFLQTKVDNLDLFGTIATLIESPRAAFKRIALSQHKNYAFLLSALFGMSIVYAAIWYKNLGGAFTNILTLLGTGLIVGPPVGIIAVLIFGFMSVKMARVMGGSVTLKNMIATAAYASVPITISLVFVFPIEIAIFGSYFFGNNPPPIVIKPAVYVALVGLDVLAISWSCVLLVIGIMVASSLPLFRTILILLSNSIVAGLGVLVLSP
jgi:hypothetical protein